MLRAGLLHFQFEYSLPVERSFQNRFQALVGMRVQQQGALAGRLQAYRGVSLGQAHDAQASAVAHLRMLVSEHKAYPDLYAAAAACIHAGITQFLDDYREPVLGALERVLSRLRW